MASRITEPQREFLKSQLLENTKLGTGNIFPFLLLAAVYAVMLLYPALLVTIFVAAPLVWLSGYFGLAEYDLSDNFWTVASIVYVFICLCAIIVAIMVGVGERRVKLELRPKIIADLEKGEVLEDRLSVAGVKLFQESEHKAFLFFVHFSNGKTLVLYDHVSFDGQGDRSWDDPPMMEIRDTFCRTTFPISKLSFWDFSGETVPLPPKLEMTDDPKKWPEDESWCRVKWENIERHYGPKRKPRQTAASKRS